MVEFKKSGRDSEVGAVCVDCSVVCVDCSVVYADCSTACLDCSAVCVVFTDLSSSSTVFEGKFRPR